MDDWKHWCVYCQIPVYTVNSFCCCAIQRDLDIKTPLTVKIFIWLLVKNSVLTKDNLLRRGWHGNAQFMFSSREETVDHLRFACPLAKFAWQVIMFAFQLVRPPECMHDFLGSWLNSFTTDRELVLCGGVAVVWTPWKVRNAACFKNLFPEDPASVIFQISNHLSSWIILQRKAK